MTLAAFITTIRSWLNREDFDDPLVTSWIRMAENDISVSLRIADNLKTVDVAVVAGEATMPADFREAYFVLRENGVPLRVMEPQEYSQRLKQKASFVSNRFAAFGSTMRVGGGTIDGQNIEVTYYASVPPLNDDPTWLYEKYLPMYLGYALAAAEAYGVDDARASAMAQTGRAKLDELNTQHRIATSSGSRIRARAKGFG